MKYTSSCLETKRGGGFRGQLKYKDSNGVWRKITKTLASKGKRDAQRELSAWQQEMEEQAELEYISEARGVTAVQYIERFIEKKSVDVAPTTTTGYRKLLKNQIAPYFLDTELLQLNPNMIDEWLVDLRKRYSASTSRKAFTLFKSAIKQAVNRDLLDKDPMRTVKAPPIPKNTPNSLTVTERSHLLAFTNINPTDPLSLGVRLALYTGARQGELCALRWKNIDIKSGTLRIVEALGRADNADLEAYAVDHQFSGVYLKQPKNTESIRTVYFPQSVGEALRLRMRQMRQECAESGASFSNSLFVLGKPDGTPMHPHNLWRKWTALATALGLKGIQSREVTFHDLRHTYATTSIAGGIDVKTVSNQMGHADASITLNTYACADPVAAKQSAVVLEELYSSPTSDTL